MMAASGRQLCGAIRRRPGAPARLRAVAASVALLVAASACGSATAPSSSTQGLPGSSPTSPSGTATAALDRKLVDTDAERASRDRLIDTYVAPVVKNERVISAMRAVPRHSFVPTDQLDHAYDDNPLPIGYGQTISQPSLVAMMTELLDIQPGDRVLEIGTGSGYQAAILGELTDEVYTVEIIPQLAEESRAVLEALGYGDIRTECGDGYFGWPEHATYDAIVVTAAPDHLPSPLVDQLSPDGRMVIPIGPPGDVQTLWLVTRQGGEVKMEQLIPVRFVPLTREAP